MKTISKDQVAAKIDNFKDFVMDSIADGHHENFASIDIFIEYAFEAWVDLNLDEEVA